MQSGNVLNDFLRGVYIIVYLLVSKATKVGVDIRKFAEWFQVRILALAGISVFSTAKSRFDYCVTLRHRLGKCNFELGVHIGNVSNDTGRGVYSIVLLSLALSSYC